MGKVVVFDYNTDGYRFNARNYRNMHVNNLYGNTSSAHQLSYESVNHIEQNVHYYDNHTKKGGFLSKLKMKHLIIGISIMISSIIACLLIMTSAMNMKTHESGSNNVSSYNSYNNVNNQINNDNMNKIIADNNVNVIPGNPSDVYYSSIVINKGDTLTSIAQRYKGPNETVKEYIDNIIRLNNMRNDTIYSGAKIIYYYWK